MGRDVFGGALCKQRAKGGGNAQQHTTAMLRLLPRPMLQPRLFCLLIAGFVLATCVGTLSHEGGHYVVAQALGYNVRIGYGYTAFVGAQPHRSEAAQRRDDFLVTLGGPIQTMLTGTIGLLFLHKRRAQISRATLLTTTDWLCVFIALFWLRQTANATAWLAAGLTTGHWNERSDEIKLAYALGLPRETLTIATAVFGAAVLAHVNFRVMPSTLRLTFLAAGLVGGVLGYLFWLEWIGPLVLP